MTTMTIAPATCGFSADDLNRFAGRADAYDDHGVLTLDELNVRADYITDLHPNLAYAQGYTAYVKGAQLEQQFISGRTDTTTAGGYR
ncbi:hypothetical protein ACFQ0X_44015 [Streptomyces rectiviolaceus]|uniref:Uncharacterized protein n=1 Tax=Streptomyces rectiviolaceus TaxID=332591 RepID=A0ABP6NNU2_9ACTN